MSQASPLFSHNYPSAGIYPANLTVTDSLGQVSTNPAQIIITVNSNAIQLSGVASRKTHGAAGDFDLPLALSGTSTIEPRTGGANGDHKIVFTFPNALSSVAGAGVSSGSVSSSAIGPNPNQYTVNVTGITNAQYITVTLTNAQDTVGNAGNVSVQMGVLLGDVTASKSVNSSDIGSVKANSGQTANAGNFRTDVATNGSINSSDIGTTKSVSGTSLP